MPVSGIKSLLFKTYQCNVVITLAYSVRTAKLAREVQSITVLGANNFQSFTKQITQLKIASLQYTYNLHYEFLTFRGGMV